MRIQKTAGLDLVMGTARFFGPKTAEVRQDSTEHQLAAQYGFTHTGTRAASPSLEGLGAVPCLDSVSIMELCTVPEQLIILGGGYIGVEFSQMFRHFGRRVSLVQCHGQLLTRSC